MIRNAQVGCRLWVARNTLVDVSICDAVDLPDARPGSLRWIRLSPLGRGHAASVEGGAGRLRPGSRPPPEGALLCKAPSTGDVLGRWGLSDQRRPAPSMPPSMSSMDPAADCPALPPAAARPPSIEFSMSLSGLADPVAPPKGLFWPPPPP